MRGFAAIIGALTLASAVACKPIKKLEDAEHGNTGAAPATTAAPAPGGATLIGRRSAMGANAARVVMVIDDGFDVSHPVFSDKVLATYTLSCAASPATTAAPGASIADVKAVALNALKGMPGCTLTAGLAFQAGADFATITSQRDSWNDGVMKKTLQYKDDQYDHLRRVLYGLDSDINYHGTNTAGLIAYHNDRVQLVLVQYGLEKPQQRQASTSGSCPAQKDIDTWVEAWSDPEVQKAFVERPVDQGTQLLRGLMVKHGVSLVNMSLGTPARAAVEAGYVAAGCAHVDLSRQYQVQGDLDKQRQDYLRTTNATAAPDVLTVQAGGNESATVDSDADTLDCSDRDNKLIEVGAYDASGNVASFSNHGKCIDYFMLGSQVVVAAPQQFLNIEDGTSFSAPLLVRYITQSLDSALGTAGILAALDLTADKQRFLPLTSFPAEVAYADTTQAIDSYTLADVAAVAAGPADPVPEPPERGLPFVPAALQSGPSRD